MPRLVCWACGRQIYTVAPLESLFAEERRCPRCGAFLREERREVQRRQTIRRTNPPHDPGPPKPKPKAKTAAANGKAEPAKASKAKADDGPSEPVERRKADRRVMRRREGTTSSARTDPAGWQD